MSKVEVTVKSELNLPGVVAALEDIVRSLKEGTLCLQSNQEYVTLKPSEVISVEIEASQKKGKEKLSIELSWRQGVVAATEACTFTISATEPALPEPAQAEPMTYQPTEAATAEQPETVPAPAEEAVVEDVAANGPKRRR